MWKHFLSAYFNFSKKERTGVIALLTGIIFLMLLPFLFPLFKTKEIHDKKEFEKEVALLKSIETAPAKIYQKDSTGIYAQDYDLPAENNYKPARHKEEFYFNPNTLSEAGWQKLGIKDKTIATIKKYIAKGGKFYKPEDLKKIWGIAPQDAQRLLPYVKIEAPAVIAYTTSTFTPSEKKPFVRKELLVDINDADTTAFIALPGIGSKLAQRIINFRTKLGGFYSVDQVKETFGLPDSTFKKIQKQLISHNSAIQKININTATVDDLKVHPYIRYNLANAIVQYRTQHGTFNAISDIKKIVLVTDSIYNQVEHYLVSGD
ncbi:MAG: helix-hairpin-helix domain-containing protein [Ginsengibacter sp.]